LAIDAFKVEATNYDFIIFIFKVYWEVEMSLQN